MTFDLEKARDLAKNPIHCPETDEIFVDAIAEIERLRADAEKWECEFPCSEERWCNRQNLCIRMKNLDGTVANQAARIKELEDALVEERAKIVCYDQDSTDEWWNDLSENGSLGKGKNEIRQEAREQLQAEGKIGPEDAKPRSWQITDERKAAIDVILARIDYDQSLPGHFNYTISGAKDTLRAMLEASQ